MQNSSGGIRAFFIKTLNGMAYGFLATLIIGIIIQQLGRLLHISHITDPIFAALATSMGVGIGIGIAYSLRLEGMKLIAVAVMGAVASSFTVQYNSGFEIIAPVYGRPGNPLTIYIVIISGYLLMNLILRKKTNFDVLLIPFACISLSGLLTFLLSYPIGAFTALISTFVQVSSAQQPVITSILVAILMGMILTSPISSAATALVLGLNGTAAAAALVGCTTQMIGFAVQSASKNQKGTVLSIAFGTSKLQFKNVVANPIIWLPTIIASAILGPLCYYLFTPVFTTVAPIIPSGAGMGSSSLVGQFIFLGANGYDNITAWFFVSFTLVAPALLVGAIHRLFVKMRWYKEEYFILDHNI